MKTFAFDFYNKSSDAILAFKTAKAARSVGNGRVIASTPDDILATPTTSGQMLEVYNHFNPNQPVKKFSDRVTAAKRMFALAEAHAKFVDVEENEMTATETVKAPKAKKEKAPKIAKESSGKRGRTPTYAGKRIYPLVDENPRREGGFGHAAMQLVLNAGKKGISFEDFIAGGGRHQDLVWDLKKGNVSVD